MSKFLCYDEDNAEERDAREIECSHPDDAAEQYASDRHTSGGFEDDTMDVMVKCVESSNQSSARFMNKWTRFTVDKEIDVNFSATWVP